MKNEIADLSDRLKRLQLRRSKAIAELQGIENEISSIIVAQQSGLDRQKMTAVDRVGQFIYKGDRVKVLTSGIHKGEEVIVIDIANSKVSVKPNLNSKDRASWRLLHNLLRIKDNIQSWVMKKKWTTETQILIRREVDTEMIAPPTPETTRMHRPY